MHRTTSVFDANLADQERGSLQKVCLIGGLAYVGSGLGFLVSIGYLIAAQGPGSPDILVTLASPGGRGLFVTSAAAGIVAVLLYVVGMAAVSTWLRSVDELAMRAGSMLAVVAAAAFVALLALQYALAQTAQEGFTTTDTPFRELVVESHAFADAAGWTGIALLALTTVIVSATLRKARSWTSIWVAGLILAPIWLVVHLLDSGYLFLVPFAVWELCIGAAFLMSRRGLPDLAA